MWTNGWSTVVQTKTVFKLGGKDTKNCSEEHTLATVLMASSLNIPWFPAIEAFLDRGCLPLIEQPLARNEHDLCVPIKT